MSNPEMVDESTEDMDVVVDVADEQDAADTEAETDGEFELVIDGEEQDSQQLAPTAAEKLEHAIIREKRKRKDERNAKNELADQVAQLQAQIANMQAPAVPQSAPVAQPTAMPDAPNKMDYVSDSEYENAKAKYAQEFQSWWQSMNNATAETSKKEAATAQRRKSIEQAVTSHFSRAAKFAEENKIPVDKYQSAEIKVRESLGSDVVDDLIAVVGEGAEKGLMYLGSNAGSLQNISALVASGNHMKAVAEFTRLASKATIKRGKKISQAPEPDGALHGDSSGSTSADKARKHFDKLIEDNKGDIKAARAYRKKMREQGIEF